MILFNDCVRHRFRNECELLHRLRRRRHAASRPGRPLQPQPIRLLRLASRIASSH